MSASPHHNSPRSKAGLSRPSTGRLTSPVQERRVILRGRITKLIASCCIARLVVLAAEDPHHPIIIYIDSPGGSGAETMGILSTMQGIRCPVLTFCRGQVGGPAVLVAAHGRRSYRVATASARFSFRLPQFSDQDGGNFGSLLPLLAETLAADTGRTQAEVLDWFKQGAEFSPQEAVRIGLIDAVASQPVLPKAG